MREKGGEMKGLFWNQTVVAIDDETIVWRLSYYKKNGEIADVAALEGMWKNEQTKKNVPQKLRRRYATYTEALLMGACLGLAIGITIMAIVIKCLIL